MQKKDSRLDLVDSLRGFALFGVYLVHCIELYGLHWADPKTDVITKLVFVLFTAKSSSIFALCFGISFFLVIERGRRNGEKLDAPFMRRLFVLFLIGSLHGLLYRGDILTVFAVAGGILLLAERIRSNRSLAIIALVCFLQLPLLVRARAALHDVGWALQSPFFMKDNSIATLMHGGFGAVVRTNLVHGQLVKWSYLVETGRFTQTIGLFITGLVLGRIAFFSDPGRYRTPRRIVLGLALLVAVILHQARGWIEDPAGGMSRMLDQWVLDSWMALCLASAQLILLVEVHESFAKRLIATLAPAGRMTLTLYVGQSLVMIPLLYGFGFALHGAFTSTICLIVATAGFLLQLAFATWWFRHFHYGPLEWVWRAGAQGSVRIPIRRNLAGALAA